MAFNYTGDNVQEGRSFEIIPVGEYEVRITEANEKISQSSGKDMIELVVQPTDEKIKGKLWEYIVDNEYAQQRIHDILSSCGCPPSRGQQINSRTFLNKVGRIKVKHETRNGETKARINYWLSPKPGEAAPAAPPAEEGALSPNDIPF